MPAVSFICIFLFLAAAICGCKITFTEPQVTSSSVDTRPFQSVLVEESYELQEESGFEDLLLSISASHSSKKVAYSMLLGKYRGLVKTLIRLQVLPNEDALIHSIIHKKFHQKSRKWEFTRYLLIYAAHEDAPFILDSLQSFQPRQMSHAPLLNYLEEKKMAMAAFANAKKSLQDFIRTHLGSEYRILLTKDVQILGAVDNEEYIEADLQNDFNEDGHPFDDERHYQGLPHSSGKKRIEIKVLFQLVGRNADMEQILDQMDREESISDFSDEKDTEQNAESAGEDEAL